MDETVQKELLKAFVILKPFFPVATVITDEKSDEVKAIILARDEETYKDTFVEVPRAESVA